MNSAKAVHPRSGKVHLLRAGTDDALCGALVEGDKPAVPTIFPVTCGTCLNIVRHKPPRRLVREEWRTDG